MKTRLILAAAAGVVAVAAVASLAQGTGTGPEPVEDLAFLGEPVTADQLRLGQEVYATNCASCHGANLEGQPDWKRRLDTGRMPAPPHDETGHTWHHADRALFTITKLGIGAIVPGYESDMPVFGDVLSDAEIAAALAYIKSTWSDRQRVSQEGRTRADRKAQP
jgi:mono/diheme cytochrome c family protein